MNETKLHETRWMGQEQDRQDCINFHQRESWMIDDRKMISKVGDKWLDGWQVKGGMKEKPCIYKKGGMGTHPQEAQGKQKHENIMWWKNRT